MLIKSKNLQVTSARKSKHQYNFRRNCYIFGDKTLASLINQLHFNHPGSNSRLILKNISTEVIICNVD